MRSDDLYLSPDVHFRKFLGKFEGLEETRLPEISQEIWGPGEKSGAKFGGVSSSPVRQTEIDMKNRVLLLHVYEILTSTLGFDLDSEGN